MVFVFFGANLEMFVDLGVENWEGVGRDNREKISPGAQSIGNIGNKKCIYLP